jgi:hypothetical protein
LGYAQNSLAYLQTIEAESAKRQGERGAAEASKAVEGFLFQEEQIP